MKTKTLAISYPSESSHVKWTNCGIYYDTPRSSMQYTAQKHLDNLPDAVSGLVDVTVIDEDKAVILDSFSFWYQE